MKHFNSYLTENQVITPVQLNQCISAQCINHQIIGYHAIKNGFVDADQLKRMFTSGKIKYENGFPSMGISQFGGLFSTQQFTQLLKIQSKNHNYLGMSIVNRGLMAVKEVNHHLRKFKTQVIGESEKIMTSSKDNFDKLESNLESEIVKRHRSFFYNMGYATEILEIDSDLNPDDSHMHYATEMISSDKQKYFVGVSVSEEIVLGIAAQKNKEFHFPYNANELYEIFAQILFNLNYSICRKINAAGGKFKHGPVQYCLPDFSQSVTARCKVANGHLDIRIMA